MTLGCPHKGERLRAMREFLGRSAPGGMAEIPGACRIEVAANSVRGFAWYPALITRAGHVTFACGEARNW